MAAGISLFLLPNELSTGGFSGIGTIVYYLFKIPLGITMIILNIPLMLISYFRVGKELFVRSIYGTIMLAIFVDLLDKIPQTTNDKFLGCIYGGIAVGIGTAIILKCNSSTGGSDLLSYVIRSFKPQYRSSTLILAVDAVIIVANVIAFRTIFCNCNLLNEQNDRFNIRGCKLYKSTFYNITKVWRNIKTGRWKSK